MEYTSFQMVAKNTGSLNTGSYFTREDYSLFVRDFVGDLWFGFSAYDVIELGVYDRNKTLISWGVLNQEKNYKESQFSYLNSVDTPVTYSYSELLPSFTLYKNDKILVSPIFQTSQSFGIQLGSYNLTYNFTREMAGTPTAPLAIKEISPTRKEIKLVPVGESTLQYEAFCRKKILQSDVSPLYLQYTQNCPYGQIFSQVSSMYKTEINTLKNLFFLTTDGAVITFLRNLYEDYIRYTNQLTGSSGVVISNAEKLFRIQGIRTYFSNYLRSNVNTLTDFETIDKAFSSFVTAAIERKFSPLGPRPAKEYVQAKVFIHDFFVKFFYQPITNLLNQTFTEKYFGSLRNALNLGNGKLYPIINHGYLDEKIEDTDPLTLIIKLQTEAPTDIAIGVNGWVSNISLSPYVVSSILKSAGAGALVAIGPPNFSTVIPNISAGHVNKSYTAADLAYDSTIDRELEVSRKQAELNVDYTDFQNFVVFSSAEVRLNIFKNKVIQMFALTSSVKQLESKNAAFMAASGTLYPFYTREYESLQGQISDIMNGFDGYEAYLYRSGNYEYSGSAFISASYVAAMDSSASYYDKNNRDSLINNTPQHILTDANNDEYVVFLSMVGHFFDEIYSYISNLPTEKTIQQGANETFTRTVIDYMLETFGWKLDDTLEQTNLLTNYLTSDEVAGLNSMSAEDIVKTIRNRVLLNLPKIYKAKGTEESVRHLLSCYGIPSTLLSIREYGGVDNSNKSATYTQYEKIFMRQWDTSSKSDFLTGDFGSSINTIEYKFSVPDAAPYVYDQKFYQWGVVYGGAYYADSTGLGGIRGGFVRVRGRNLGKVFFEIGRNGVNDFTIYSDPIPIFDGNVYSVMVRKNAPDPYYQASSNVNEVPTKYDLYVQRNEGGRVIVRSTSSYMNYNSASNYLFNTGGYLMIVGWFSSHNRQGYTGTFDKWMQWLDPITDSNFEDHVNNPNSYAFSGSRPGFKSLTFRQHTDYPFNMRFIPPPSSAGYIVSGSEWLGVWPNSNPYYSDTSSYQRIFVESGVLVATANKPYYWVNWAPWSGSQKLVYDPVTCQNVSQSCYPYQFKEINYPVSYTISKYGPNRFRNEKIRHTSQSVEARFDIGGRSTYVEASQIVPDSNLVGVFADPNDFKNKDIIRYFGNFDLMSVIGSPQNSFSSSYDQLRVLRKQYADMYNYGTGSNPRFGELMTLYKLYFNRSVFEAIRNLTPARSNVLTGVLIEPTILERPKYQAKPIASEVNTGSVFYADVTASRYFRDRNTKLIRITESLQHAEFNIDTSLLIGTSFNTGSLPNNLYMDIDLSYINDPCAIYPINYLPYGSTIMDYPDVYQMSHFGQDGTNKTLIDMVNDTHPTGSRKFRLLKQWDAYAIWSKDDEWNRTANPRENLYVTNSIYLYKYILVDENWYSTIAYTADANNGLVLPDPGYHYVGTFKNTANQTQNNLKADPVNLGGGNWGMGSAFYRLNVGTFLEIANGYPRNHYTHKRHFFSPYRYVQIGTVDNVLTQNVYIRGRQTISTTIGSDGLDDGTLPVQSYDVSNLNLVKSDNVINQ